MLNLPRATTANWTIKLAQAVIPIINLLNDHLLDGPLIHCDETTLQVLRSDKAPSSDHFMWVRAGGLPERNVLLFDYASSRSAETAKHLLLGFKGILLTDGYEAHNSVAEAQSLVHAGCLAHVRRYFKDVIKSQPDPSTRANIALDYIGKLYDVERGLRQRKVLPTANEWLDARQKKCVPIMTEFKAWLDDLAPKLPPHQLEGRIEAHIFVAFLAYCLHVTLRARLKPLAPGLMPRAVLDKLAAVQMLDVQFPTTDGRTLIMSRYTELNADQKMLVKQLNLNLPQQPPPRITVPAPAIQLQTSAV